MVRLAGAGAYCVATRTACIKLLPAVWTKAFSLHLLTYLINGLKPGTSIPVIATGYQVPKTRRPMGRCSVHIDRFVGDTLTHPSALRRLMLLLYFCFWHRVFMVIGLTAVLASYRAVIWIEESWEDTFFNAYVWFWRHNRPVWFFTRVVVDFRNIISCATATIFPTHVMSSSVNRSIVVRH